MMDDVTIRLRLFAGSWEASAFNEDGQKRKAVCPHYMQAVQELLSLLNTQEAKTDKLQSDQYVVPQWVKDVINELIWYKGCVADPGEIAVGAQLSRLLTQTTFAESSGIFSNLSVIQFCSVNLKEPIKVDFSDLPLTAENFKETLIKRCQRVGQAIVDAEKPKPIDPDERLMDMDEVEKLLVDVKFVDGKVVDKFGRIYGTETSTLLTGTTCLVLNGIFEDEANDFAFMVDNVYFLVDFNDKKLSDLDPSNVGSEILVRVFQVRKARAKQLEKAATK